MRPFSKLGDVVSPLFNGSAKPQCSDEDGSSHNKDGSVSLGGGRRAACRKGQQEKCRKRRSVTFVTWALCKPPSPEFFTPPEVLLRRAQGQVTHSCRSHTQWEHVALAPHVVHVADLSLEHSCATCRGNAASAQSGCAGEKRRELGPLRWNSTSKQRDRSASTTTMFPSESTKVLCLWECLPHLTDRSHHFCVTSRTISLSPAVSKAPACWTCPRALPCGRRGRRP